MSQYGGNQNSGGQNGRVAKDAEIVGQEGPSASGWQSGHGGRFGAVWTYAPGGLDGCWPACVTFALFLICLAQYGILAGIGFLVFHMIGAALGSLRAARMLASGIIWNPWAWRVGNWFLSFILTAWLAGGMD